MREILFKAKRIDNGEWVEGNLVTRRYAHTDEVFEAHIVVDAYEQLGVMNFGTQPVLISPLADKYTDGCFRVDPKTICQYTGLTDKNGNKIWENDVVKHYNNPNKPGQFVIGTIYWNEDNVRYERTSQYKHAKFSVLYDCVYEVIGNIFDNPELLKGGE